ncbi:STAS domain-containing protein [candidate division KSB1 bacterium]|nr:STAS domain-containing protein [candidate division KSB1 bacterium]
MALEHQIIGEIAVVNLTGKLQGGTPDSQEMKDAIQKLLDAGVKNFVLDLAEVKRMHSSGLGVLISLLTSIRNRGGDLKLAAINETMEGILAITKLNSIFETFGTVTEATQSFTKS